MNVIPATTVVIEPQDGSPMARVESDPAPVAGAPPASAERLAYAAWMREQAWMAHVITSARAVSETRDVALMAWARRNLECELERRGDALRFFRRRARISRFPAARHEALAWEARQRHHCLAAVADMAALLDEIDGLAL